MPSPLQQSVAIHERIKEQLIALYGEEIDHETLMDSLEGETDVVEMIASVVRSAQEEEALAFGLDSLISSMTDRKRRLVQRAERKRAIALRAMEETGRKTIKAPDFTLSMAKAPDKVLVTDEAAIPARYMREKVSRSPDKTALKEALRAGVSVPGAVLSNGGSVLKVRIL